VKVQKKTIDKLRKQIIEMESKVRELTQCNREQKDQHSMLVHQTNSRGLHSAMPIIREENQEAELKLEKMTKNYEELKTFFDQ